ncbi:hypothetical protein KY347_00150 [Candidatus Woesearchaeota archaeon]|nr:hypothetical protein [Candidatus Woesearchaeota archaeon]
METAIISSSEDKASTNIKEHLIEHHNFSRSEQKFDDNIIYFNKINGNEIRLYTTNSELTHAENIDRKIGADLFVFISRHQAKEERKSLTAHAPGNFGKAEFGGKEKRLCVCPAAYLKNIFNELHKNTLNSGYEASMEATHHGPFLEKPVLFVEIGTTEKEWEDKNAGKIIAKSLFNALNNKNNDYESVFVIGGAHYNYIANKLMLKTNMASGHICAKYNLENLNSDLIKEAMEKSVPKAKFVLLDWKGLGREKHRILDILEKNKIEYKRSDRVFES